MTTLWQRLTLHSKLENDTMMSIAAIRSMNRESTLRSAERDERPLEITREDIEDLKPGRGGRFRFPHVGYQVPDGLKLVRVLFVDSSGWGSPSEPALTITQFAETAVPGRLYASMEFGQFQVHVGEFVPEDEEVEVDLTGKGVYPPDGMLAEVEATAAVLTLPDRILAEVKATPGGQATIPEGEEPEVEAHFGFFQVRELFDDGEVWGRVTEPWDDDYAEGDEVIVQLEDLDLHDLELVARALGLEIGG